MGEVFGFDIGAGLPGFFDSSVPNMITWIFIAIAIAGILGLIMYLFIQKRVYRYNINVFENISGSGYQLSFKDKARLIKLGNGGQEVLYLKKKRLYRSAYGKKMGANTYWFAIGPDGYYYNITLGDLDTKTGVLDVEPVEADVRMMYEAIRKNTEQEFGGIKFMDKYGSYIFGGLLLVIILIGGWLLIDKIGDLLGSAAGSVEAAGRVNEASQQILSSLDNICSGGKGVTPINL